MALGIGLGLSFLGGDDGGGAEFTPITRGAALKLWLRADLGITTVMAAVVATGTAPPAVTLTGTNIDLRPIEIDISTIGTLGIATFQWKLGGVVQQTGQVTAATFVLGTTGLTANFPAGAYANDNVYVSNVLVSAWADQSGNGNNVSQGTAVKQPLYVVQDALVGGQSSLNFTLTQVLNGAGVTVVSQPNTTYFVASVAGALGQDPIDGAAPRQFIRYSPAWGMFAGAGPISGADTGNGLVALCGVFNSASSSLYKNNSVTAVVTGDASTNGWGTIHIGSGTDFNPGPASLPEVVCVSGADSAGQRAQMFAYFAQRYGGAFA
jgi:hypothetical protein